MTTKAFIIHALSPLHSGVGQAVDIIDLPIARMKASGIPYLPGSSIKGVLRDVCGRDVSDAKREQLFAVFGPETRNAAENAGALFVSDARLLALPVRSLRGTFAWVTSPLLLELAHRDLMQVKAESDVPEAPHGKVMGALVEDVAEHLNVHQKDGKVYLEDLDLPVKQDKGVGAWAALVAGKVMPDHPDVFRKRFIVVDDETMTFLWETATQVDARVRIDPETRTVANAALWYEESLPPETLLIGLAAADRGRRKGLEMPAEQVLEFAMKGEKVLQFGGKATVGRGRCRVCPLDGR